MLTLEDIFVVFDAGTSFERVVLRGISFNMQPGDVILLVGGSGSGRTTLLKMLAGHVQSNFGCIHYEQQNITHTGLAARNKIFSTLLYEHTHRLSSNMTVLENIASLYINFQNPKTFHNPITKSFRAEVREKLAELNFHRIEDMLDTYVAELPLPHRQVLSLFMSGEQSAPILLLDDHLVGLDNEMSVQVTSLCEQIIQDRGMSAIITADSPETMLSITNRLICLKHGSIVQDLSGDAFFDQYKHLSRENMRVRPTVVAANISSDEKSTADAMPADTSSENAPVST